ncbi:PREDICTED: carbonic anhydrase 2-like [Habropoda laboriosa]|uniref:carbonic anhydrase 2-like n=1 Tax=Habropoda laboriosa TaxID=597456 RepID=UPI00083E1B9A|nr:PREDICTED: carbonic anhydrase 2-like [Habropoda laboriosa]
MAFLIFTLGLIFSPKLVAGNFSYDGSHGPSHWGNDYKTCLGKYQSPIDIEESSVKISSFPPLKFSSIENSHAAYMINNGHTVMIQSFDPNVPMISGGPIKDPYVFQQLHFHWGQNDELGSEDLINNHSFSMEVHAVFWKKEYGSSEEAMKHPDGLTVLGYLYQVTDKPNPTFESIVSQMQEIATVGSNVTINDTGLLSKLVAPDLTSAEHYFTYKGSLTTPPCLEIVQWIDFIQPQHLSHEQIAAFRSIQSIDGTNLTHNFRPVQPLDGRTVYRNSPATETTSATSGAVNTTVTSETTVPSTAGTISTSTVSKQTTAATHPPTTKVAKDPEAAIPSTKSTSTETPTVTPLNGQKSDQHSGQQSMWTVSPFAVILGIICLLSYQ